MTTELFWLTMTALLTAVLWIPYILDRIMVRGLVGAMGNPSADDKPQSEWAQRAMHAHRNAVENLAVFAALVLVLHASGAATSLTATMTMIFFYARLAHYLVYLAGVPVIRTLVFAIGWVAQMIIGLTILGIM